MDRSPIFNLSDVPLSSQYWDVPVSLSGRAYNALSHRLDRQLHSLEVRWAQRKTSAAVRQCLQLGPTKVP